MPVRASAHMRACLRACVCVHACARMCVRPCMGLHAEHTGACWHVRACLSVRLSACVHACMRACVDACMRAYVHACQIESESGLKARRRPMEGSGTRLP